MLIRVVSYNIHKGFSARNRKYILPVIKERIQEVNADLVFLQEIIGSNSIHSKRIPEWPQETQFEFLADQAWPYHAYGKNAIYQAGHHGNAFLSKFPIIEWNNTPVSTNRFEHRGILHAVVASSKETPSLHCLCTHMGLTAKGRKIQIDKLCHEIETRVPPHAPLIVAGDFNDWRGIASPILHSRLALQEAFQRITGKHAASYPALRPLLNLDRIYCRNLQIIDAYVLKGAPWKELSDHAALYAEFAI